MDDIKKVGAKDTGPGGIACNCCRPGKGCTKREAQTFFNRRARRQNRQEMHVATRATEEPVDA
jgi:hypothetical protein